jgi:hypothetical protein
LEKPVLSGKDPNSIPSEVLFGNGGLVFDLDISKYELPSFLLEKEPSILLIF